jgi:predicted DNA-binding protein (MmcQ/YjbR family)
MTRDLHGAERRLREICMAFPGAHEEPFGGHTSPCWRVRGKIFAMLSEAQDVVTFKGEPGAQDILVSVRPETFFVPKYVGHRGWVGARLDAPALDWDELAGLLEASYRLTAPRSLLKRHTA